MKSNRRHFLNASALGLGALTLQGLLSHRASAADKASFAVCRPTMRLGLVTYNLASDWDIPTIIKNCEAARFDGVELRTTHGHKVEVNLSKDERNEVKKCFADSKVQLMGLGSTRSGFSRLACRRITRPWQHRRNAAAGRTASSLYSASRLKLLSPHGRSALGSPVKRQSAPG